MNENKALSRARDLASGSAAAIDLQDLERKHGSAALRAFLLRWQRWPAIDKRRAVLFGHADNRHGTGAGQRGTVRPDDMEEAFLRFRYAYGEGWQRPAETRAAEVEAWLTTEATPPQAALFRSLLTCPAALDPVEGQLARLLVHFAGLLKKLNRLPTRDELRAAFFPSRECLDAGQRQAFKRSLKALGLDGLPNNTLPERLPEQEGQEPFDVLTRDV